MATSLKRRHSSQTDEPDKLSQLTENHSTMEAERSNTRVRECILEFLDLQSMGMLGRVNWAWYEQFLSPVERERRRASRAPLSKADEPTSNLMSSSALWASGKVHPDITDRVVEFLALRDTGVLATINKAWKEQIESNSQQCESHGLAPSAVPADQTKRGMLKDLYQGSLSPYFIRPRLGNPGPMVPIPIEFIQKANCLDPLGNGEERFKDNYTLVFIPETLKITVPPWFPLTLSSSGHLYEEPSCFDDVGELKEVDEKDYADQKDLDLEVPVNLNNLVFLEKYLKLGVLEFHESSGPFLTEHGDERVRKSHWSYQRRSGVGRGLSYTNQETLAKDLGLEVAPFLDRCFFVFLSSMTRENIDWGYGTRTSTRCLNDSLPDGSRQLAIWWKRPCTPIKGVLFVGPISDQPTVGVAVQVPAGSSQAIGS